jgi:nucleotide-binding universal stress UspA family protein
VAKVDRPILVGVDGSLPSLAAVDVGLREAALRGLPVRIVQVDTAAAATASDTPAALSAALDRAAAGPAEARLSGEVLPGDPSTVLVRESATAALVVVGHRGLGGLPELLLGSVAVKVAAHAHCPTVVVRGPGRERGDVVVGVDGSGANDAAIGFAFEEADLRGAELLAIHAVTGPAFTGPSDAVLYDPRFEEARTAKLLAEAVVGWHDKHPTVSARRKVVWAPAARTLVDAAGKAQLVVVGARGASLFVGVRLGSICHTVLHHAECPIAVVRDA